MPALANKEDRASFVAPAWGMVPLRVVIGLVFLMHGSQKLLVNGLASTAAFFDSIGIPIAQVAAALVTALEILGGSPDSWPRCSPSTWGSRS